MRNRLTSNSKSRPLDEQHVMSRDWIPLNNQINQAKITWYAVIRQVPDLLTLLRLVMAVVLLGSGMIDGQATPARDIWFLVIGWTTDMADGRIARSIRKERRLVGLRLLWTNAFTTGIAGNFARRFARRYDTIRGIFIQQKANNTSWLGSHDVYVDMFVSLAVLGYLAVTSLLPLWLIIAYLLVWGVLFLRWGVPEIFAQIFQNPIYAAFVILTVQSEPAVLPWLLLWAGIALLFFWRRMVQLLKNLISTVRG